MSKAGESPAVPEMERNLEAVILDFRPWLGDGPAAWIDLHETLRRDPDRKRREEAWFALVPLAEAVEPGLLALIEARNREATAAGTSGFPEPVFQAKDLNLLDFMALSDELEHLTRPSFEAFLDWAREFMGGESLEPWDVEFALVSREPPPDRFPGDGFPAKARELLGGWGIDLDGLPISFHEADSPFGSHCRPAGPGDIRVVINPRDGLVHYEEFLRTLGHGLCLTLAPGGALSEPREPSVLEEGLARVVARAGSMAAFPRDSAGTRTWDAWRRIHRLRRELAEALFEILLYDRLEGDLHSLHCEIHEHYLGFPRHPERLWAASIAYVARPLHRPVEIMGELAAAQLLEGVAGCAGADLPAGIGSMLREGRRETGWEDRLREISGRGLGPEAYLLDLGLKTA